VPQNFNGNAETNMTIIEMSEMINVSTELCEVELRKIPFGTFAGALNRLVVLKNGEYLALDTGDQGGGQN
jgi:hypothetical protein